MDDFERRRELRRQKREEMRLEAERIAYQRNDDDEEEAARERRRRARQERLRQKQEEESLGQVTDQVEAHVQNSVPDEESKPATANTQVEGDEEAALLERLARREERRQKRLQEALERQKEFDPTITDGSLSVPSRRMQNDSTENETAEGEEKRESRSGRYEVEETEVVIKSYQKNSYQDAEDKKKEEKEEEEEEEESLKGGSLGENQVEEMVEEKTSETQEEAVVTVLENGQVSTEESKVEGDGEQDTEEIARRKKMGEEERERAEAERLRLEVEEQERERIKAEHDRKLAEEQARIEAEQKAAAEERARREAEERARIEEEQRRVAEEQKKAKAEEEKARIEEQRQKKQLEEQRSEKREAKEKGEKGAEKADRKGVNEREAQDDRLQTAVPKTQEKEEERGVKGQAQRQTPQDDKPAFKKEEVKDEKLKKEKEPKEEVKSFLDRKKGFTEVKAQNGEFMTHKLKQTENAFSPSRSGGRASGDKEAEGTPQVEAGKRLEELRRRRGETESEEFEKLKQKQQEAALELEELKKKREERRKVLEEEEQKRKQEEADRKAREEEEKRRLKEEIERRRAEAAEKRQKMPEDGLSEDKKPFKCFTPKGSSLKIEERAEFLNKSVQKSGVKSTHQAAVVSKIDSRLEQYTNAIEGTKASRPMKPAASDLPVPAEGVRSIKSMWEKGSVFSSPSASGTPNKETAGLKVGVSSRINEWLTKSPDGNKSPAPKPSDLRPGDVSGKRNLWEKQSVDKVTSPTKQV
ncbi:caldesmon isoform X1 [Mastomys coucha]|uniref:caldesmon isoform X1 n=1 Tax=Mastomys coucha TaxID=35658 RepID=UPI0012614995|nr:caldesmon isoform X1 [Mastomys coucha]XP_031237352.1 caldesmon isoform X1 [Mastomys coucha]XP_031237353.1 caldesmon isoform X1 [Mastomys coucha]XP_031237354.1 caldesmon isoform X1 [Mastomys coucha]XP_031237356.1 caldesmon isoform X1 [Mastomys coucha]